MTIKVNSAPTFCWHCRQDLARNRLKGGLHFELFRDAIGNAHRVHKGCKRFLDARAAVPVRYAIPAFAF